MRKIAIVGVDSDSGVVECEISETGERVELPLDGTLRSAARGEFSTADGEADGEKDAAPADASRDDTKDSSAAPDLSALATPWDDAAVSEPDSASAPSSSAPAAKDASSSAVRGATPGGEKGGPAAPQPAKPDLRPKEIQARVRAGASIEDICTLTGLPYTRVEAFAYPILQERGDKAERARKAHPMLADGPSVETIEKLTHESLEDRGIDLDVLAWDAWRIKSGNWVVEASWPAGLSDDASASWEFVPDSHGGVGHPLDDEALAIGDPSLRRELSAVADEPARGGQVAPNVVAGPGAYPQPANSAFPPMYPTRALSEASRTGMTTGVGGAGTPSQGARPAAFGRGPARASRGERHVPHDPTNRPEPYVIGAPIELDPEAGRPRAGHRPAPNREAAWTRDDEAATADGSGPAATPNGSTPGARDAGTASEAEDGILRHPPADGRRPAAKSKHPTMPSWEDVLLGVRSPKDK